MEKKKQKHIGKKGVKVAALYTGLFALAAGAVYLSAPFFNGSFGSDDNGSIPETPLSNTDRFMAKLTETTGMKAEIKRFALDFPDKDNKKETYNRVSLKEGSKLLLAMPDTSHIGFHLDTAFTLETPGSSIASVKKDLFVNYDNQDLYLSFLGAKYKYEGSTYNEIMDNILSVLGAGDVTVSDNFYDVILGLFGSIKGGESSDTNFGFSFKETSDKDASVHEFVCTLTIGEDDYEIGMSSDADFNLTGVKTEIVYQDITLNLDIVTDVKGGSLQTIASMTPKNPDSYVSLVNMNGVFTKVAKLVKGKRFGVTLDASLTNAINETEKDVTSLAMGASIDYGKGDYRLGLDLYNPSDRSYSQKIDLAYLPKTEDALESAYLSYNDAYKVSLDRLSMDALISRIQKSSEGAGEIDTTKALGLFSFLTESEVMQALSEGHYQPVVNMIDDLVTENDKIIAGINLKGLGLGEKSKVSVTIDGNKGEGENVIKLLSVTFSDIELGQVALNGTLSLDPIEEELPAFERTGYNSLEKLPDIYDQFSDLANSKRFGLDLDVDLLKGEEKAMALDGSLQFDVSKTLGTGVVTLDAAGKKHRLTTDFNETDVRLQYQDAEKAEEKGTLAKINISTITDLVSYLGDLMGESTATVTLDGASSVMAEVAIANIIQEVQAGHYSVLASTKLLKSYSWSDTQSVFTVDGDLFGLSMDPTFSINYGKKGDGENAKNVVDSVSLSLGIQDMKADATLSLKDYDAEKETSIDPKYAASDYNDFSYVNSFARALGNTASLDTYHVKAEADVTLWTADLLHLDLDFAAYQGEKGYEYYVKLSNIPLIPAVNSPYSVFFGYTRSLELLYKEDTVYLSGINPFGEHGYLSDEDREAGKRIDWTEKNAGTFSKDYLSKNENLLKFLLGDVLNVQPRLLAEIKPSDTSMPAMPFDPSKLSYEKVLESTSYDEATGDYALDLNIGAMLNSDYVVKASLGAKKDNDNRLSQVSLSAFVFAGVRIDLSFQAALIDAGNPLDETTKENIASLQETAIKGEAH